MHPRFLEYYERELEFIREMGREFAKAYPQIGARLDLDSFECADPYVERLLEGFAFLTGRIQLKLDAEFPRFTQHLLELVYPHYLAPVPSMAVVQFDADTEGGVPPDGYRLDRGTRLFATATDPQRTRVELRTGSSLELRPLRVSGARYVPTGGLEGGENLGVRYRGALQIELETLAAVPLSALSGMDRVVFFLGGSGRIPWILYEWIHAHTTAVRISSGDQARMLPAQAVAPTGFTSQEALLPVEPRSLQGYRLLQEYFALPQRYRFFAVEGIAPVLPALARDTDRQSFSITILFDEENPALDGQVQAEHFSLHCVPAVNLFPRRCDRVVVDRGRTEYRLVVDRTRPQRYEVHSVVEVEGYGEAARPRWTLQPFYRLQQQVSAQDDEALYYTLRRSPRQTRRATRHVAHDVYLSIVDPIHPPFPSALKQLGVRALCTNGDLCQRLQLGGRLTDFHLDVGAPVTAVRALAGPSAPRSVPAEGEYAWRLISHLNLNYQALGSTETLRELLGLYGDPNHAPDKRQIEGLTEARVRPVVRRLPGPGPMAFGRGSEVTLRFDRGRFEGMTPYLIGVILAHLLRHYTSINSFVETRVEDHSGNLIARIPAGLGHRTLL